MLLVWLCLHTCSLISQGRYDPQGVVRKQLLKLAATKYGPEFSDVGYSILDSLIAHSLVENHDIRDLYGTLKGCILFSTFKDKHEAEPDTFIVGVARDGQIVWDNAPGSLADVGGDLLYAQDINNDGEVDLLVTEVDREYALMRGPSLSYLYILSWNGIRGRFINAFEAEGGSALIGCTFELARKDRTGARQIVSSLPNLDFEWRDYRTKAFPQVTYTWNGKQYALWLDTNRNKRGHYGIPSNVDAPAK